MKNTNNMPVNIEDVNVCRPCFEKGKHTEIFLKMCQVDCGSRFPPSSQSNIKGEQVNHQAKILKTIF